MKVLFLEIDTEQQWALTSLGPACLGAWIRRHGHQAAMLRVGVDQGAAVVVAQIKAMAPDLLALSLTTRQWLRARSLVGQIRQVLDIPVIAGGHHPTFAPETVLDAAGFDYVCIGEGEAALLAVLAALGTRQRIVPGTMANIAVARAHSPALGPLLDPLERLPFMARDLMAEPEGVVHLLTQRGCPFACTYCSAAALARRYRPQHYHRRRSVNHVMAELAAVERQGPINYVVFLDDTFTTDEKWVLDFCRRYGDAVGAGFSINARVETVGAAMLDALAEAGCRHVIYGVESGSEKIRRQVLNRKIDNQRIIEAFDLTRTAGMLVTANYMLGIPGETPTDIEATLALNEILSPHDFGYFVFYPYPGTLLFETCQHCGYLPEDQYQRPACHRRSILTLPEITDDDIAYYHDRFTAARERAYLKRFGQEFDNEQTARVKAHYRKAATTG
ncbi:MAG: B12-binding domain-containing radical SAM protein [Desulfobacterales bacterium]|nr:B12-binding domain-containing radical SAM protein [Desulfobacterales bacterium]